MQLRTSSALHVWIQLVIVIIVVVTILARVIGNCNDYIWM